MPGFLDFIPLFAETADTIRARLNADTNPGLDPSDPAFLDLTEGGFFFDLTQAPVLECERLWDAIATELPMACFPAFAWGTYLDEHGITLNIPRKNAVAATGTVTFNGTAGTVIAPNTQVSTVQTDPTADPLTYAVTIGGVVGGGGSVDLAVTAVQVGSAWNVPAGAVTVISSPLPGVTSVSNAAAMAGGADVEDDEIYRQRILIAYEGAHGSGTVADYEQWALEYPGVGHVVVVPIWNGAGTVKVVVTDLSNHPVSAGIVSGLQAILDPVAGQGRGLAPIGAIVTVATPATTTVNVAATLTLASGYSHTGAGGTVAVDADVTTAIQTYINTLAPGSSVILQSVVAAIMSVTGVVDTSAVTLNGSAANITIDSAHVAASGTVTLT